MVAAALVMTVLGLIKLIDLFHGKLTAMARRLIPTLSLSLFFFVSLSFTPSYTHSLADIITSSEAHSLTVSVFLSLSKDLRAASTSPTTAAITSALDLDTALELDPG